MGKSIKISPIKVEFNGKFKTMDSSLSSLGYKRMPGTKAVLTPRKLADGRYMTGLNKNAPYLRALPKAEQELELKLIDETLAKLKEIYGEIDFGPRSIVWNVFAPDYNAITKEGTDVKASPIALSNGDVILDTDNPQDLINFSWVRIHPDIAKSLESYQRGSCPDCHYYIADDEAENRIKYQKNKKINKAIADFETLTPTKARQIARLMDLPVTDDSSDELVYNFMTKKLNEATFLTGEYEGVSTISVFENFLKVTDDELYIKDLVEQALRHNIYRKGAGDKIMEGNQTIAGSRTDLISTLLADQKEVLALASRIKTKQIAHSL